MFLTKIAILDSVLTSFVVSSILCYFFTFYVNENENNKKYFWILTYVFSALATFAKGIPGMAIPFIIVAIASIVFRSYKDTLKYSWRLIIFLFISIPWHLIMLKLHGSVFFDEYIVKHHILRFLGSEVIHRNEPWYFYLITLLWGLFPHIFLLLSQTGKLKHLKFNDKFLILNFIAFMTILVFFSLSGAKLITYILPIYPFASVLLGEIWFKYIESNDVAVHKSLIFLNIFLTFSVLGLILTKSFMPADIFYYFKNVQQVSLIIIVPFLILNWIFCIRKKRWELFVCLAIFMSILSGFLTPCVYEFNYSFGQNELIKYAKFAKDNKLSISTYLTGRKYSLLYYGDQPRIEFQTNRDLNWLKKELAKENHILIIRNKNIPNLPINIKEQGIKYSIIGRSTNEKK